MKLSLDVSSTDSIDAALSEALKKFGRIDVMVNNAGVNFIGIAEAFTEASMRSTMETNFWGPMHLTRKAIAIFRDINPNTGKIGGTVVNVTSIGGRIALPAEAGYHASKFALEGWTEAIASELSPAWKIRIMLLEPGGTKSQFTANSTANAGPRHPAYDDPEMPVNVMIDALTNPKLNDGLADTSNIAKCLFDTLQKNELPLRLTTGLDAFRIIKAKETAKMEELEKWRGVTESVGGGDVPV